MASLVMVVGSAVVNAVAFSGSNYLFSTFDKRTESKRHDEAMEQLTQAQQQYERDRTEQMDFIHKKLEEEGHANETFQNVDDALHKYYIITGESLDLPPLTRPVFSDFYTPSITESGELVLIALGMITVYYVAKKIKQNKN